MNGVSKVLINTKPFDNADIKLENYTIGFRIKNARLCNLLIQQSKIVTGSWSQFEENKIDI